MVTSKNLDDLRTRGHGYIVGRNRRRSGEVYDSRAGIRGQIHHPNGGEKHIAARSELSEVERAISNIKGVIDGRVRRGGGGRHAITKPDHTLLPELKWLVEPATRGDPVRPLMWVSKSHEKCKGAGLMRP